MLTQSASYALGASAIVIFVLRVRDLIGPSVFFNLLLGLYHRPIAEERIFLFIDIVGSTAFAARQGGLATQSYLGRFVETLALPVRCWGGSYGNEFAARSRRRARAEARVSPRAAVPVRR